MCVLAVLSLDLLSEFRILFLGSMKCGIGKPNFAYRCNFRSEDMLKTNKGMTNQQGFDSEIGFDIAKGT